MYNFKINGYVKLLLMFLILLTSSCGGGGKGGNDIKEEPIENVTSLRVSVAIPDSNAALNNKAAKASPTDVDSIEVVILNNDIEITRSFLVFDVESSIWSASIDNLPIGPSLTLKFSAKDTNGELIYFSEQITQLNDQNNNSESVVLRVIADDTSGLIARAEFTLPTEITVSQTSRISVKIIGAPSKNISYSIELASDSGTLSSNLGVVVLNPLGEAVFQLDYTAPNVVGVYNFKFTLSEEGSIVEQTTTVPLDVVFETTSGGFTVLFAPSITRIQIERISSNVVFTATVADDGDINDISYQWRYIGNDDMSFESPTVNPATLQNYDTNKTGVIELTVTDLDSLQTIFALQIGENQFPNELIENEVNANFGSAIFGSAIFQ